ncbi:MAG: serine/threonine-protein kinase [Polyangiaceae bacterium]
MSAATTGNDAKAAKGVSAPPAVPADLAVETDPTLRTGGTPRKKKEPAAPLVDARPSDVRVADVSDVRVAEGSADASADASANASAQARPSDARASDARPLSSGTAPRSSDPRSGDTPVSGDLRAFRRVAGTGELKVESRLGRFREDLRERSRTGLSDVHSGPSHITAKQSGQRGALRGGVTTGPALPPLHGPDDSEMGDPMRRRIDPDDNTGDTITRQWEPQDRKPGLHRAARPGAGAGSDPPPSQPSPFVTLEPALLQTGFAERYGMRELLGRGGMGEVRLCKDRHIGREVAIKVIRPDHMTRPDVVRRFEREARVQGQLEHPAIVPVYDFGVAPDGSMYFTMKRLRGVTFHDVLWMLRNGDPTAIATYSRRKLLTAFNRACLAIAFAHSRGVLHRDLKPSNIMLGDFGEVYVLDWGLAKIRKEPHLMLEARIETPASSEHRTIVGEVVGTPGYMAPEQALGEVDRLDPRTDVYALGAILFELLTLEPLHKEDSPEDVLLSTLYGPDARASVRAPGRDVPLELEAIILKATGLKQEDRFSSARDLYTAVEQFLDGDRDLEQKKQMATEHAAAARVAAAEARKGGKGAQAARERAMREVGAALALNPSERDAVATLVRLMLDVPDVMPPDARREFIASQRSAEREKRRAMLLLYLAWLAFVPPAIALGVRDWPLASVVLAFQVLACVSAWASYRGYLHDRFRFLVFVAGSLAMCFLSFHLGWAVLIPGMAAAHVLGFLLYGQQQHWGRAIAVAAASVVLPFVLQVTGVVPSSYGFHDGNLIVMPHITSFPPAGTLAFLLLASLGMIVAPAVIASRVRTSLARAEERLFMQSWMLRHLVPDQARTAASVLPGPPSQSA